MTMATTTATTAAERPTDPSPTIAAPTRTFFRKVPSNANAADILPSLHLQGLSNMVQMGQTDSLGDSLRPPTQAYGGGLPPPPPLLLFYLNHPIQFVQVVGVVVVFEDFFEKFWLFTVDDGSGATIDVTCRKPEKAKQTHNLPLRSSYNAPSNNNNKSARAGMEDKSKTSITSASTATEIEGAARNDKDDANADAEQLLLQATLSKLHVGAVVQAKGTLSTFRSVRQLTLLRLTVLPDTAHEMALISSRTAFCKSTLSKPWVLSADELKSLAREAQDEKDQGQRRAARRRERLKGLEQREQRHAKHIREQYEADEKRRMKAANAARRAGEILQHGPTTK
ncbi:hypothetical protein ABEF95_003405 [Exophiala dermatitidis]